MKKNQRIVLVLLAILLLLGALYIIVLRNAGDGSDGALPAGTLIVTDIDGNEYPAMDFGGRLWLMENLSTTRYNDGSPVEHLPAAGDWSVGGQAAWSYYNNVRPGGAAYGVLYNWHAVESGRLCPEGWHVPDDAEWSDLVTHLGGDSVAGGRMKEGSLRHWTRRGRDDGGSGFSALPAGYRYTDGSFYDKGQNSTWWTSTPVSEGSAAVRLISRDGDQVYSIDYYSRDHGFSVRCVQDTSGEEE